MKTDESVIANLQATCGLLAHLVAQYRVDAHQLRALDVDWLAVRLAHWQKKAEEHLGIAIDALLYFEADPAYAVPMVSKADSVTALLERDHAFALAAFMQLCGFRKAAWDVLADDIPDVYEHAIQMLKKQIVKMERELKLLAAGETEYILARLEDGGR